MNQKILDLHNNVFKATGVIIDAMNTGDKLTSAELKEKVANALALTVEEVGPMVLAYIKAEQAANVVTTARGKNGGVSKV